MGLMHWDDPVIQDILDIQGDPTMHNYPSQRSLLVVRLIRPGVGLT